ncbi:MAG: GNAT family protein [Proteobacteria bacterium]|nr:GNAT family protein [Pseudomonadota bacterium]
MSLNDSIFETNRLRLRPLLPKDLNAMYAYRSDPDVCRFQGFDPQTCEEVDTFILSQAAARLDGIEGWRQLGIEERKSGLLVGDCGIWFDAACKQAEFGITIAPTFQGNGFAVEILNALFNFVFTELKVHRIKASVDPRNRPSMHLMNRLGMRQEAHHRESLWFKNEWVDDVIFAMLAHEWSGKK